MAFSLKEALLKVFGLSKKTKPQNQIASPVVQSTNTPSAKQQPRLVPHPIQEKTQKNDTIRKQKFEQGNTQSVTKIRKKAISTDSPSSEKKPIIFTSDAAYPINYKQPEAEVRIGIDFGTSNLKLVISDLTRDRSYIVPFFHTNGIDAYLLPCNLWETDGTFSLHSGNKKHSNLKLDILSNPDKDLPEMRGIAFLALILKHAKNWLLHTYKDIYASAPIFWGLAIGIPSNHISKKEYTDNPMVKRFKKILTKAWELVENQEDIIQENIENYYHAPESNNDEINVYPELSAQIYGFLKSKSFDDKARNIFAMIDIGAGTIDTGLFTVFKKDGAWHFYFFTNNVEHLGVYNLQNKTISNEQFYRNVLLLCRNKTFYGAIKKNERNEQQLSRRDLEDEAIPVFYCGGGQNVDFYKPLRKALVRYPNISYITTREEKLNIPYQLKKQISLSGYHRVSVAFGLSLLDVATITQADPLPPIVEKNIKQTRFIRKDDV